MSWVWVHFRHVAIHHRGFGGILLITCICRGSQTKQILCRRFRCQTFQGWIICISCSPRSSPRLVSSVILSNTTAESFAQADSLMGASFDPNFTFGSEAANLEYSILSAILGNPSPSDTSTSPPPPPPASYTSWSSASDPLDFSTSPRAISVSFTSRFGWCCTAYWDWPLPSLLLVIKPISSHIHTYRHKRSHLRKYQICHTHYILCNHDFLWIRGPGLLSLVHSTWAKGHPLVCYPLLVPMLLPVQWHQFLPGLWTSSALNPAVRNCKVSMIE